MANHGPDSHELIVVRGDGGLPPADGMTVDEDGLEPRPWASSSAATPGRRARHLNLAPGRYELLCNMSGHYMGGMHTDLIVG